MVMNLKVFLAVLVSLAFVGCNGDEDEEDSAYTLEVAKPSSPKVGTAFDVVVKLHKDKKLVTGEDATSAKDGKVTGSIKCKEGSEIKATEGKFDNAGKATLSITIADNSDKDGDNDTGYTDCKVSASAEFGKDKTKATGDSETFPVAAKTEEAPGGPAAELTVDVSTKGLVEIENGTAADKIVLANKSATETCGANLVSWSNTNEVGEPPTGGFPSNTAHKIFVIGPVANCKVKVGSKEKDISSLNIDANKVSGVDVTADTQVDITFVASHGVTGDVKIFVVPETGSSLKGSAAATAATSLNVTGVTGVENGAGNNYTVWVYHSQRLEKHTVTQAE